MAKRKSNVRAIVLSTFGVFVCAVALPWGPQLLGCEFDTTPRIHRHPPVKPADDADSGEDRVS